jgi:hypothetical protein
MNILIVAVLIAVFSFFGFCIGCMACTKKINDLEFEKAALTEWLEAARTANTTLIRENDELRADIEAVVNGEHIIAPTLSADQIYEYTKEKTKVD